MIEKKKTLKRSVIFSALKQVCSLIFPLVTIPYITRTIGSVGYGQYSFATSLVSYFAYIAAFGISTYAIRECSKVKDERNDLNKLFSELLNLNILFTIISYVLLVASMLLFEKLHSYTILILIYSVSIGLTTVGADWVNIVFEEYEYITIRYIIIQIISLILMFVFVKSQDDVALYCGISMFAGFGGNIANIAYIRKRVKYQFSAGMGLKKHFKSLAIFFISSLGILIYVNSDITMLGLYLPDADVGVYGFCSKLYGILKVVVYSIVSTSAARMAYLVKNDERQYLRYMDKIFTTLIIILFPLCTGGILLGSSIIMIVGGAEYLVGINILVILMCTLPFAIMCSYFSSLILIVNNQEKIMLFSTIVSAASNILLNLFFIPKFGAVGAAVTTLIAEFISFVIALVSAKKFYDYKNINIKVFLPVIAECVAISIICCVANNFIQGQTGIYALMRVIICVVFSGTVYLAILLRSRNESIVGLVNPILVKVGLKKVS